MGESMQELSLKVPEAKEDTMMAHFKIAGIGSFELELERDIAVRDVKKLAKEQCNIEPEHMRLVYKGRQLKESDNLEGYDAKGDEPVQLFFTAGHVSMMGGVGGTGGGRRANVPPQRNP